MPVYSQRKNDITYYCYYYYAIIAVIIIIIIVIIIISSFPINTRNIRLETCHDNRPTYVRPIWWK